MQGPELEGTPDRRRSRLLPFAWRLGLAGTVGLTLYGALTPPRYNPPQLFAWEKGDHVAAFAALAVTAAAAFPRSRLLLVGGVLVGLGAAIELLQALPFVNRDPALTDVGWDALGLFAGLIIVAAARWALRRRRS